MNHNSVSEIRTMLETYGLALKKRWGQNFLVDERARARIIAACNVTDASRVWEIGPGLGALTDTLVQAARTVTLFEIDHGLVRLLTGRYGDRVEIIVGDAASTVAEKLAVARGTPDVIVGNLPYRSASAIISSIAECPAPVPPLVVMVQSELADRFLAPSDTSDYSALSVLVQARFAVHREFVVPGGAFYPAPRVGSTVVSLAPAEPVVDPGVRRGASTIARIVFSERRKRAGTILRRRARGGDETARAALEGAPAAGIDLNCRAGEIPVADYLRWSELGVTPE